MTNMSAIWQDNQVKENNSVPKLKKIEHVWVIMHNYNPRFQDYGALIRANFETITTETRNFRMFGVSNLGPKKLKRFQWMTVL